MNFSGAILDSGEAQVVFLPLMTHDAKLLPVHFVTQAEVGLFTYFYVNLPYREVLENVCRSVMGIYLFLLIFLYKV